MQLKMDRNGEVLKNVSELCKHICKTTANAGR